MPTFLVFSHFKVMPMSWFDESFLPLLLANKSWIVFNVRWNPYSFGNNESG